MTKAQRIYEATEKTIRRYVRNGQFFDSLNHLDTEELIAQRTVNDLMKLWNAKAQRLEAQSKRYQRHPEEADRYESLTEAYKRDVEVLRRMYLTIQTGQAFIDELKAI